jgi:hypothetical protein
MALFDKKRSSQPNEDWALTSAEILDVKYGMVHNTNTGVGGSYERSSANKTLQLRVEPAGGASYEAILKLGRDAPNAPYQTGTRLEVLVDPTDLQRVALPSDPTFTLSGGQTWQPTQGLAGAIADATKRGDAKEVMRLSAELSTKAATAKANAEPADGTAAPGQGTDDTLLRLEKLGKLRDSGVLNEHEFNEQKARILGETG